MRRSELQREKKHDREEEEEDAHKTQRTGASRGIAGFVEMRLFFGPFFLSFFLVGWATNKAKFNWQLKRQLEAKWPFFLVFFLVSRPFNKPN